MRANRWKGRSTRSINGPDAPAPGTGEALFIGVAGVGDSISPGRLPVRAILVLTLCRGDEKAILIPDRVDQRLVSDEGLEDPLGIGGHVPGTVSAAGFRQAVPRMAGERTTEVARRTEQLVHQRKPALLGRRIIEAQRYHGG